MFVSWSEDSVTVRCWWLSWWYTNNKTLSHFFGGDHKVQEYSLIFLHMSHYLLLIERFASFQKVKRERPCVCVWISKGYRQCQLPYAPFWMASLTHKTWFIYWLDMYMIQWEFLWSLNCSPWMGRRDLVWAAQVCLFTRWSALIKFLLLNLCRSCFPFTNSFHRCIYTLIRQVHPWMCHL